MVHQWPKVAQAFRGAKLSLTELEEAELPCILHWRQNHFVVLYKIKYGMYYIADPGSGLITLSRQEFIKNWITDTENAQGIVLLLSPTPHFYEQDDETPAELRQQESKYIAKQSPLLQTGTSLIAANSNYLAKQKEILELDNQMAEERSKFLQALNSLVSQAEDWKTKYVLTASQKGKVSFAGIIQENQVVSPNQEVFYINAGNNKFFGEMNIPQNNLGKVKDGQDVLIKLKSYPFEEYGMLRGKITYIADVPFHDSIFVSRVSLRSNRSSDLRKPVILKQGMIADAEIITQDATIFQRLSRNLIKAINNK